LEVSVDSVIESRRVGVAPVPADLGKYLNDLQLSGLREVEHKGWSLKYIRRPAFQTPYVVLVYSDGKKLGLLEEDGRLNQNAMIPQRGASASEPDTSQRKLPRHLV
jgi:hypothetical protein